MLLRGPISPRAYAELCLGSGWEECKRGRSGGVRVERSPAPRSVPGFACHPLARSAAENSIITAGESGDWERKIRDPATLVAHARPRRSIPNTHTFFPGLGKSPKAAPSAGKRLSAPSAAAPQALHLYGPIGALPGFTPVPLQPTTPGVAACKQGAGERANDRASQPASGGCHPTLTVREVGGTEGWHPGAERHVAGNGPGNARRAAPRVGGLQLLEGHLLQLRGRRGRGEEGEVPSTSTGLCN